MPKLVASGLGPSEFEALKLRPPTATVSSPRTNSHTLPSEHPSRGLSWVSLLWVSWLNPLIHKASTMGAGQLVAEDIWPAPTDMSAEKGAADIRDAWETEMHRASSANTPPSLVNALFQAFKPRLFRAGGECSGRLLFLFVFANSLLNLSFLSPQRFSSRLCCFNLRNPSSLGC